MTIYRRVESVYKPKTSRARYARRARLLSGACCAQAPLQPLQDNLESQTYEVFEKDPVKYAQYEARGPPMSPAMRPSKCIPPLSSADAIPP